MRELDQIGGTCVGDCLDQLLINLERFSPLWTAPFCRNQITDYINIEIKLSTGEIAYFISLGSLFLVVDVTGCFKFCLNIPVMVDCDLELWGQ